MRNAMICASFMLAVFLAWPLAFGDGQGAKTISEGRKVMAAAVAAAPSVRVIPEAVAEPVAPVRPESCYKRFQREVKLCSGASTAACKLGAADHWDMCEATGFWPQ